MAVNDSNAPKNIPTTGELSPGNASTERSINLLKNIKTSTGQNEADSSINSLRNWFRTYVGNAGNFTNSKASGSQINLSDFRGAEILGVDVKVVNETNSTYGTKNDAKVILKGLFSQREKYRFIGTQGVGGSVSKFVSHGDEATLTGFDGEGGNILITIQSYKANNKTAMMQHSFQIVPAYGGTAKAKGLTTDGSMGSMGVLNEEINFTYSGGAGKGKTSNSLFLLTGKRDPSGRPYGPSMSYP